jgi:GNAT superfamily N-acetyltransferase
VRLPPLKTDPADFAVRPPTEKDYPFILQSWVRTYARSFEEGPLWPRAIADAVHASVQRRLSRAGVEVAVATNPTNPWFIFAYVVFERTPDGPVVHWVYVKDMYRNMGIGSDLVAYARGDAPGPLRITYRTPAAARLMPEAVYAPKLTRSQSDYQRKA